MLDDSNVLKQRDPKNALGVAAQEFEQAAFRVEVQRPDNDGRPISKVVVTGMGGSALAALMAKSWLGAEMKIPLEVIRGYTLPQYVDSSTLVIASSYSGNTEETVSALDDGRKKGAQLAIITSGGTLIAAAEARAISHVVLPANLQPRMAVIYNLRALTALLGHFKVTDFDGFDQIANLSGWLGEESAKWSPRVTVDKNYAKQLALLAVGKTPVFYGGDLTGSVAYKWKISWNENAKNVAFYNEYPEFNHNEFMGWTSHPIEKPFAIFDLISSFEHPQILKRFSVSDRLLSGKRPKANVIHLQGETLIAQLLWGSILADFVSIYVAILNGVDPTPVELIERLKEELKV